jgi:hypothetical protein
VGGLDELVRKGTVGARRRRDEYVRGEKMKTQEEKKVNFFPFSSSGSAECRNFYCVKLGD